MLVWATYGAGFRQGSHYKGLGRTPSTARPPNRVSSNALESSARGRDRARGNEIAEFQGCKRTQPVGQHGLAPGSITYVEASQWSDGSGFQGLRQGSLVSKDRMDGWVEWMDRFGGDGAVMEGGAAGGSDLSSLRS